MRALGRRSVSAVISGILTFGWYASLVGLFVAACVLVALPFVPSPNLTVTVPVSFSLDTPSDIQVGRSGLNFEILDAKEQARRDARPRIDSVDGSLRIPTNSRTFIAANAAVVVVVLVFVLFVVRQLRAVFWTLVHGNPFVPGNAARLRLVGLAVLGGEFARAAVVFAENYYAKTHVVVSGLHFDAWPHLNFAVLGQGLIILVIAEVFRAGTRLDEEQSLTI